MSTCDFQLDLRSICGLSTTTLDDSELIDLYYVSGSGSRTFILYFGDNSDLALTFDVSDFSLQVQTNSVELTSIPLVLEASRVGDPNKLEAAFNLVIT